MGDRAKKFLIGGVGAMVAVGFWVAFAYALQANGVLTYQQRKDRFMAECEQHRPAYECRVLFPKTEVEFWP